MHFVGHKIETTSDNFGEMARGDCLLVDKTLMIKEFWEGQKVSLITRPRRFGKTINMSMLQHFFASEVAGQPTEGLFHAFAIARENNGEFLKQHQGKYPVIFITFKDVKESSYERTIEKIRNLIKSLYREHASQLELIKESASRSLFEQYLNGLTNDESLALSLTFLSEFLFRTSGKKAIILIDEYDTPLTHAYQNCFLDEVSNFMRNMFSAALKGNVYLEKGGMTGILRVSKNELLSGLNNLKMYSLFDEKYSHYFGFTKKEVAELTKHFGLSHSSKEIRQFYNGYIMGETVIYNPWSLMHYLDDRKLAPYWVLTSGDKLLKNLFLNSNDEQKEQFSDLMQGKKITAEISLQTRYEELMEEADALWTLLLFSGYLTATSKKQKRSHLVCELRIPNEEILSQYQDIFSHWLKTTLGGNAKYSLFLKSLLEGNVEKFTAILGSYLIESLSFRDVVGDKKAENFYHGFVAGLIASVRETHWVDSNKESGHGLYDVVIIPRKGHGIRGIIIEFKHTKRSESLEAETKKALDQIDQSKYATVIERHPHIAYVLKVGLAFSGKAALSAYKEETLATHKHTEVSLMHYKRETFGEVEVASKSGKKILDTTRNNDFSKRNFSTVALSNDVVRRAMPKPILFPREKYILSQSGFFRLSSLTVSYSMRTGLRSTAQAVKRIFK